MKKALTSILFVAAVLAPTGMDAATVRLGSSTLSFTETTPCGKVRVSFAKCMANDLYTFSSVTIDNVTLNQTGSDNIGPFSAGYEWMGGNHTLSNGQKSAKTIWYKVYIDDEEITGAQTVNGVDVLTVEVLNELYYSDGKKFCDEKMVYTVSGNSIDVKAHHDYTYPAPMNIGRYYGMQSMFVGENELLLPGTPHEGWIELPNLANNAISVDKKDAPNFTTFIEKGPNGYQASYLYREDLGKREWVQDNDWVFTCQSYGIAGDYKSYHKVIGDYTVKEGMSSDWHGLYSWFKEPVADSFRDGAADASFSYIAYIDGVQTTMTVKADGTMVAGGETGVEGVVAEGMDKLAIVANGEITLLTADAKCFDVSGKLVHEGAGSFKCVKGVYLVSDSKGRGEKLLVQ